MVAAAAVVVICVKSRFRMTRTPPISGMDFLSPSPAIPWRGERRKQEYMAFPAISKTKRPLWTRGTKSDKGGAAMVDVTTIAIVAAVIGLLATVIYIVLLGIGLRLLKDIRDRLSSRTS